MVKMKNLVSIILAMVLCFSVLSISAYAVSDGEVITEDEYVYFVVQEGAVREVSQNEYSELVDGQRPNNVRTTGSWSINNSLLEAGKGKYYSQENIRYYLVNYFDYITCNTNACNCFYY